MLNHAYSEFYKLADSLPSKTVPQSKKRTRNKDSNKRTKKSRVSDPPIAGSEMQTSTEEVPNDSNSHPALSRSSSLASVGEQARMVLTTYPLLQSLLSCLGPDAKEPYLPFL